MYPLGAEGPEKPDLAAEQRRGVAQRFRDTDLPLGKLWTYYYGIGGDLDEMSLDAFLHEALDIPASQAGLIATAMTELTEGDTQ
ncbi:hypothetical protein FHJ30_16890 [Arthrobacter sp. BB-1]|jgi:hypothetical protein|uniref:hypothetical protein n=1 Tax=Micrococcaceae TaxID=1268 RepID=UPI0011121F85|nr:MULTISPECIES: hypothetical protein [Micrococcaceae]TNB69988.1 hypothetical protein FHJ30_16890 [Arthrobacter sp. BB-1]UEL28043.1 hypothetical protein KTR40_15930 [Pseudarthrobacter sp. L1SW]